MKKQLFTLALALTGAIGASAQLAPGTVAPDFTFKDLNGNTHRLYDYLNAGKTVIMDVSAAWCTPCWNYHNSNALEDVWKDHGPTGGNGVKASTTNDVMVLMVEGESTNTRAQLYGTGTSGSGAVRSTDTKGDWVTGTLYPIIDTNASTTSAFNSAWQINAFPTVYMICRDRLVYEVGQLNAAGLYARVQAGCPTYGPSATTDAKAVVYTGQDYYFCNATPSVKFQNYSQTNNITSASIKVYSGSTVVSTTPWTGSLAPYAVTSVNIPATSGSTFSNYKYEVVVTGDAVASNNTSEDSVFKIYMASNAVSVPNTVDFENVGSLPYRYSVLDGSFFLPYSTGGSPFMVTGPTGASTRAMLMDYVYTQGTDEFVLGNFNTASATNLSLDFDIAWIPLTANSTGKLEVLVSKDCGATWSAAFSKDKTALATGAANNTAEFIPNAAANWRHESVSLAPYKDANMLVKFRKTGSGNYGWLDNIKISPSLSVGEIIDNNSVKVFPNPAQGAAQISFDLKESAVVSVDVVDAMGRTVASIANNQKFAAGTQQMSINTSSFAAGVYNVVVKTEKGTLTQRLSVVK